MNVFVVVNPKRFHKLLPLLADFECHRVNGYLNVLRYIRLNNSSNNVVLVDTFGRWGLLALFTSFCLRAPLILRLRGDFHSEIADIMGNSGINTRIMCRVNLLVAWLCFYFSRGIVVNSKYLLGVMRPIINKKKFAVVYNPFTSLSKPTISSIALPQGGIHLLSVTNMHLIAKVEPLMEAMDNWLCNKDWESLDVHWVVCGGGPFLLKLKELLASRSWGNRVILAGSVNNIATYYEWSDVVVHLTKMDAFPNVPMEAFMSGKPVIANNESCGTLELVLHGVTGQIVHDMESFRYGLGIYAASPSLRQLHAQRGGELVCRNFTVETQRLEMNRFLRSFLDG